MKITQVNIKWLLTFLLILLLLFRSSLAEGGKGAKELLEMADKKGMELSPEQRRFLEEAAKEQEKAHAEYYKYRKDFPKKWKALKGKWKTALIDKIQDANRIEIRATPVERESIILHIINGNNKVKEFLGILEITESKRRCDCYGEALLIFLKDDRELAKLSWHHGLSLRWHHGPWLGDALLTKEAIVELPRWFDAQGYSGFNDNVEKALKGREYFDTARRMSILIIIVLAASAILFVYGIYKIGRRLFFSDRNTKATQDGL